MLKKNNHISTDTENSFNKNPRFIHDKNSQPSRKRRNYLNVIRSIYKSTTFNTFNDERLNASPLSSRTRPEYLLSLSLFNTLLQVPITAIRHGQEVQE